MKKQDNIVSEGSLVLGTCAVPSTCDMVQQDFFVSHRVGSSAHWAFHLIFEIEMQLLPHLSSLTELIDYIHPIFKLRCSLGGCRDGLTLAANLLATPSFGGGASWFDSQQSSVGSVTPVPRDHMLSPRLLRLWEGSWCTDMHAVKTHSFKI